MTIAETPTPELRRIMRILQAQLDATKDNRRQEQHLRLKIGAIRFTLKERGL